jgi:hypothetical protein
MEREGWHRDALCGGLSYQATSGVG